MRPVSRSSAAYDPDGNPLPLNGAQHFGDGGIFESDAERILIYTCPSHGLADNGSGFLVVSDQITPLNDFEFFDRQTGAYLGKVEIPGVNNTDGVASTQRALPDYPRGLFVTIDDDATTLGLGWDRILDATGLESATPVPVLGAWGSSVLGLLPLLSVSLPGVLSICRRAAR